MKKSPILIYFLFFLFLFTFCFNEIAFGNPIKDSKKVVMFIMDNINYDDLVLYGGDNIKFLLSEGALGLMNTNTGGVYSDTNAYATIGAGSKAVGSTIGNCSGGYDDKYNTDLIRVIYNRNTGLQMNKDNVANIDIYSINRYNEKLDHPVKIGILGSLLNENKIKTAVIGNESTDKDRIKALASLITMNENGITNFGKINNSLLIDDYSAPFGLKTDYEAIYNTYNQLKNEAGLIVIQSGDTHRLNKYMGYSDNMFIETKKKIFKSADEFIGNILREVDDNTLFLVVVPFPSYKDIALGKKLTPIIAYKKNMPPGLITSSTTKRDGIITNTDISAEILNHLGLQKNAVMTGNKFIYKKQDNSLDSIQRIQDISVFNYTARPIVMRTFIGAIIVILLASVIVTIYFKNFMPYLKPLITSIMITPTVLLLIPILQPWDMVRFSLFSIGIIAILSYVMVAILKDNIKIFVTIFMCSAVIIVVDTFLNNPLMKVSILGYDPIAGARFYGIGNEYMGFLLGSTAIGTSALLEMFKKQEKLLKFICLLIYLIVLFTLAMPFLGTNVGGAMAGFICFGSLSILLFKGKISLKDLNYIVIMLIAFLVLLFVYDGARPQDLQSHIGQTSLIIKNKNIFSLLPIFKRKLLMNFKLIKYSNWTLVLFGIIIVLGILFKWPVGIFKEIFCQYKYMYYGFIAGTLGVLGSFAFNDSGVVAAATFMIPIGMSLILLNIDKIHQHDLLD